MIIFLSISLNICLGCSKELSHRDGSFEYPQHMFWLRNNRISLKVHTLIWRSEPVHIFSNLELSNNISERIGPLACTRSIDEAVD